MKAGDDELPRVGLPPNRNVLILSMGAVLLLALLGPVMVYSEGALVGEGNMARQIMYTLIFVAVVIASRPTEWRRLIALPIPMVVVLGICWLSLAWSIAPVISLRRLVLTTMVVWLIFVSVRQLGSALTINMMRIALCVFLVANYVAVLLFPEFGIHQRNVLGDNELVGSWRGVMMHKNLAGEVCALLIPLLVFDAPRKLLWLRVAGIAAAAVFLYFSHSKTSLGLVGIAVLAGYGMQRLDASRRAYLIPGTMVIAAIAALLNDMYRNPLTALLRDPTAVTGRSAIWRSLLAYVNDHPWLGSGYGAFWNIGPDSPIFDYAKGWITEQANGHNGFLDLAVQLGIPSAVIIVIAIILIPILELAGDGRLKPQRAAIALSIIAFAFMHNATETSLLDRDVIMQVFLMFALALIPALKDEAARAERRRALTPWSTTRMRHALS